MATLVFQPLWGPNPPWRFPMSGALKRRHLGFWNGYPSKLIKIGNLKRRQHKRAGIAADERTSFAAFYFNESFILPISNMAYPSHIHKALVKRAFCKGIVKHKNTIAERLVGRVSALSNYPQHLAIQTHIFIYDPMAPNQTCELPQG